MTGGGGVRDRSQDGVECIWTDNRGYNYYQATSNDFTIIRKLVVTCKYKLSIECNPLLAQSGKLL